MNIINYIDKKNQLVSQSIKKVRSDLLTIQNLLDIKQSNDINMFIKIENQLMQYGGADVKTDIIQIDNKNNSVLFDDKKNQITITSASVTPLKFLNNESTTVLVDLESINNFKLYKPNTKINLYVVSSDGVITEIKILMPIDNNTQITQLLPQQLSTNEELKFKLYKSLALLDMKNKYAEKFNKLIERVNSLKTNIAQVKTTITQKMSSSNTEITTKTTDKINKYLDSIQSSVNAYSKDYNEMSDNIKLAEKSIKGLNDLVAPPVPVNNQTNNQTYAQAVQSNNSSTDKPVPPPLPTGPKPTEKKQTIPTPPTGPKPTK